MILSVRSPPCILLSSRPFVFAKTLEQLIIFTRIACNFGGRECEERRRPAPLPPVGFEGVREIRDAHVSEGLTYETPRVRRVLPVFRGDLIRR